MASPGTVKSRSTRATVGVASWGGAIATATSWVVTAALARGRDLEPLRREHLADRRLEKLHLVRRRTDDQVDLPGGGTRIALRRQGGPRANEQGEDAAEK